ncbi:MAG: hypothetical protein AAF851_05650 [Myxococcota bacterium]
MSIGDERRLTAPPTRKAAYHPRARFTGEVPRSALASAYALSTTGGMHLAAWAYPADYTTAQGLGFSRNGVTSQADEWTGQVVIQEHVDAVRFAYTFAVSAIVESTVEVSGVIGPDETPAAERDRIVIPGGIEGSDIDPEKLVVGAYPRVYEGTVEVDVATPSSSAVSIALRVRTDALVFNEFAEPLSLFGFQLLSLSAWGVVR